MKTDNYRFNSITNIYAKLNEIKYNENLWCLDYDLMSICVCVCGF